VKPASNSKLSLLKQKIESKRTEKLAAQRQSSLEPVKEAKKT
jgi:hypothetical protein